MASRRCARCGGVHMLQTTEPVPGEKVTLCVRCREKGKQETEAAQERMNGRDA